MSGVATDIFEELFKEADELKQRMESANRRTQTMLSQMPDLMGKVEKMSADELLQMDSVVVERAEETTSKKSEITSDTIPIALKAILDVEELMARPPDFGSVDEALLPEQREEHGPCSVKFTDPEFFQKKWMKQQRQ